LTAKYLEESANAACKKNMEFKGAILLYFNEKSHILKKNKKSNAKIHIKKDFHGY